MYSFPGTQRHPVSVHRRLLKSKSPAEVRRQLPPVSNITDYTFTVLNNPEVLGLDLFRQRGWRPDRFLQRDGVPEPPAFSPPVRPSRSPFGGWVSTAQDEWKVKPNLTLTLALRAEKNSNPVCQTDCGSLLNRSFDRPAGCGPARSGPYDSIIQAGRHQLYRATDTMDLGARSALRGRRSVRTPISAAGSASPRMPSRRWLPTSSCSTCLDWLKSGSLLLRGATPPPTVRIFRARTRQRLCPQDLPGCVVYSTEVDAGFSGPALPRPDSGHSTLRTMSSRFGFQQALGNKPRSQSDTWENHGVRTVQRGLECLQ